MAYMSQEKKARLAPAIKAVLNKYGVKGSIKVGHHTSLEVTLQKGKLDLIGNQVALMRDPMRTRSGGISFNDTPENTERSIQYLLKGRNHQVNPYYIDNQYTGACASFMKELVAAMNDGNHDNSDIQTDYFDVGWYIHVNVGKWNKPYEVI